MIQWLDKYFSMNEYKMNELTIKDLSLAQNVRQLIDNYLEMAGKGVTDLHQLVLEQIEPPLLRAVMEKCKYNQSRAAKLLGISRGTCRTLLIKYFDSQYCDNKTE